MGKEKQSAGRHGEEFWAQESKTNIGFKLMAAQGWEQGQGLGKGSAGRTNFIRAKKKTDVLGLGAKQGEDDSWSAMTGMYNELLQRLAVQGGDHVHENGGASKVVEVEDTSKTLQDYIVKKRLYGRFRKAKDTCGYSENDMAAILGKKTEPTTPKPDQLGYTRAVTAVTSVEKKNVDDGSGVTTVTSKMSIRDYFSKKMSLGGSKYSAAGGAGFTEEFQESHFNQLSKVADAYHGKMGLGSGRSADPWEDNHRPTLSSSYSCSASLSSTSSLPLSSSSLSSTPITEKDIKENEPVEKSKKNKKKREPSPPPAAAEPVTKSKKSKKDPSSSSAPSVSTASSASASVALEPSVKKSKKSKSENTSEQPVTAKLEAEKPKKNKKAKVSEQAEVEVRQEKKGKKSTKAEEIKRCSFCNSLDVPMTCGRCQQAFYCGVACQSSHWATHKLKCKLQC